MMRDANAHHLDDPAQRWSAMLDGTHGRRREALIKALRNSVDSGYPASAESVRILVSYAQGQISARQYVAQTLEALGFVPAAYSPAQGARQPESWRQPRRESHHRPDPGAGERRSPRPNQATSPGLLDFTESRIESSRRSERFSSTITQSPGATRQDAVQAYVSGQIPMEEFLRRSHARNT